MAGNNLHVSDGVGVINTPTITGIRAVGNNIIQCDSLAHFPTGKFYATTYGTKTDTAGNTVVDESTIQDFVGTALNNQITILSFCPGYTDKGNKAGDYVVVKPTAASANDVADRLDTTVYDHALASVNNENLSLLSPGVVSGLAITAPASGTTVSIGGSLTVVDEAIVADANGKKSRIVSATKAATQLNIAIPSMTSGQSVNIAIIAHKASSANNGTWAYVAVPGTPATAGSQLPPTKSQIESVVPSGANGQFYAIIATAIVPQGASSITQGMVSINNSTIPSQNVSFAKPNIPATSVIMQSASNGGADLGTVYSRTISSGYGSSISLKRVGNIVFANGVNSLTGAPSGINNLSETIPYGYRPSSTSSLIGFGFSGSTPSNQTWLLNAPSGTSPSSITALISSSGNQNFFVNGSYITADPITPVLGDSKIALS